MTAVTVGSGTATEAILRARWGRHLAVVPAWNESATIAGVVERLHREAPECDVLVVDDGSTDDTARSPRSRRPRGLACRSTSASAGRCRPASCSRWRTATTHGPGRRRRPARPARVETLRASCDADPESTSSSARASSARPAVPRADQPPHRHPPFAFLLCRSSAAGQRPDVGLPLYNRRAIGLFARDYPHDYPEVEAVLMLHHHRLRMRSCRCGCSSAAAAARRSRLGQVRVLHDQGAPGPLHRLAPPAARAELGGPSPVTPEGSSDGRRIRSSRSPARPGCWSSCSSSSGGGALLERYALLWLVSGGRSCSSSRPGATCSSASPSALGIAYPPNALFFLAFASILVLLLHFSIAVSRLADQSKILAQRVALLEERTPGDAATPPPGGAGLADGGPAVLPYRLTPQDRPGERSSAMRRR